MEAVILGCTVLATVTSLIQAVDIIARRLGERTARQ